MFRRPPLTSLSGPRLRRLSTAVTATIDVDARGSVGWMRHGGGVCGCRRCCLSWQVLWGRARHRRRLAPASLPPRRSTCTDRETEGRAGRRGKVVQTDQPANEVLGTVSSTWASGCGQPPQQCAFHTGVRVTAAAGERVAAEETLIRQLAGPWLCMGDHSCRHVRRTRCCHHHRRRRRRHHHARRARRASRSQRAAPAAAAPLPLTPTRRGHRHH